jgi:phage shock protein C
MSDETIHPADRTQDGPPPPPPSTPPVDATGPRRLTRSRSDRVLGGVAGGIGRHLGIDPIIVRLAFVAFVLAAGSGILAYIIAWIVIPDEPADGAPVAAVTSGPSGATSTYAGLALIGVGGLLLVDRLFPGISWRFLPPIALILLGVVLIVRRGESR